MYPALALSRIIAVQPVLDALEREQDTPRRTGFEHLSIGQTLPGQVKSQGKGVTLVEIEGQTVAMRLPYAAEIGDRLRLRFAGHMPQAVFLLETPEGAASPDTPQLSPTARLLSELVQQLPQRGAVPTLTPPVPLLDHPPVVPADIAVALRAAVVRSGLFYESHLADWATGQDTLEGLMLEPQNRLAAAEAARSAGQPGLPSRANPPEAAPSASASAFAVAPSAGAEQKALNPMHALLSQQLQVLETPQFAWRGEVWPGQMLEWQVRREADEADGGSARTPTEPAERAGWDTQLRLTLPTLGAVTVHLKMDAHQAFSIRVVPEAAASETTLQQHRGELVARLAAAGCTLQTLSVQHESAA